ncbi:MAG TPA: sugar ABC transporter permease [Firmicutes bacterium]|nr:sugar ABC transporter permease [Bacillota bacterium]
MARIGKRISLEQRRRYAGLLFILPFIIGFAVFILQPVVMTVVYSLHEMVIETGGGYALRPLSGGAFSHYLNAFTKDAEFPQLLVGTLRNMAYQTPIIAAFSLFMAIVLSQPFRGRLAARAVFFLPIIVTSGVIINIIKMGLRDVAMGDGSQSNLFNSYFLYQILVNLEIPDGITDTVMQVVNGIVDLVWRSGVQILIFIAGLLAIPKSYYEVAQVEGATGWETFVKVTFPSIAPHMVLALIYTIIDYSASYENETLLYISDVSYTQASYSYGSALSIVYFIITVGVVSLLYFLLNRKIHYET